jgi:hypothetical protein
MRGLQPLQQVPPKPTSLTSVFLSAFWIDTPILPLRVSISKALGQGHDPVAMHRYPGLTISAQIIRRYLTKLYDYTRECIENVTCIFYAILRTTRVLTSLPECIHLNMPHPQYFLITQPATAADAVSLRSLQGLYSSDLATVHPDVSLPLFARRCCLTKCDRCRGPSVVLAPREPKMGMIHTLYRFLRLQKRRLDRAMAEQAPPSSTLAYRARRRTHRGEYSSEEDLRTLSRREPLRCYSSDDHTEESRAPKARGQPYHRSRRLRVITGRLEKPSLRATRAAIAVIYVAVALIMIAHFSGRRPLRILTSVRFPAVSEWAAVAVSAVAPAVLAETVALTPPAIDPSVSAPQQYQIQDEIVVQRKNHPVVEDAAAASEAAQKQRADLLAAQERQRESLRSHSDIPTAAQPSPTTKIAKRLSGENIYAEQARSESTQNESLSQTAREDDRDDGITEESSSRGNESNNDSNSLLSIADGDEESDETEFRNSRRRKQRNHQQNANRASSPGAEDSAYKASPSRHVHAMSPARQAENDKFTRRCYFSGKTEDALCVHTPLCVRPTGVVYVGSENLRCAPYSNVHGISGTLSARRCADTARDVESRAEIVAPELKSRAWLEALEKDDAVRWFEGETAFLTLSKKAIGVAHFAQRIFFLHHILMHPERYGMRRLTNVVIVADPAVVKKMKFRKSFHLGLLNAIVHPAKPLFVNKQAIKALSGARDPLAPGDLMGVFVSSSFDELSETASSTSCFRRAVIPGALYGAYLFTQERFPGLNLHEIASGSGRDDAGGSDAPLSASKRGAHFDGAMFRKQVFASLDRDEPLPKKRIVFLHRGSGPRIGRSLNRASSAVLEASLSEVAVELDYKYFSINVGSMSYGEQVLAVGDASIAVGVHGGHLLSTVFMAGEDAALVEVFPYRFWHALYRDGCGSGLFYQSMSVSSGEDFAALNSDIYEGSLEKCVDESKECRLWYRSDDRQIDITAADASEIVRMVREAAVHLRRGPSVRRLAR